MAGAHSLCSSAKKLCALHALSFYTHAAGQGAHGKTRMPTVIGLFLLTLEGDWALGRDPIYVSHYDVMSPFPPSGNEGYIRNRDVFFFI